MIEGVSDHPAGAFGLAGKRAVVTGAGGGIGLAIAEGLLGKGAKVGFLDIDEELVHQAVAERPDCLALLADVTDAHSIQVAVDTVVEKWGSVDILINCAGISTPHMVDQLSEEDWRRVIDVNLTGPFLCSQAVLPLMIQQRHGKIINVASVAAKRISFNGSAAYTASKAGLLGLTRHLAYEVAGYGINVNAICAGPTLTPLMQSLADEDTLAERVRTIPLGRLNTATDYVNTVLFLVSDMSEAICGVALEVDGGSLLGWTDVDTYRERRAHLTERFTSKS